MKLLNGARPFAVVVLLLLLAGTSAAAASRVDEKAARDHLEEMERYGILRDPYWAQAYWTQALEAPDDATRVSDLRWALRFDPALTEARWSLCRVFLRQRDPELATQALLALELVLRSFLAQQRVLTWILAVGGGALLAAFVLLALTAIGRAVPRVHHGVWERLLFLPSELRRGATLLTVLMPLALALTLPPTAALFWVLLLGTVGSWQFLRPTERRTCVTAGAMVLLAPVALAAWTRISEPSLPGSYLRSLWTTQSAAGHAASLDRRAPEAADRDASYHASLALLERRAGRYREAAAHLKHAVQLEPGEWAWYNNLGNVQLLAGDTDDALDSYAHAVTLAPDQPLIRVNEAQAWMRKLQFTRADQALAEATRLGYRLPHLLNTNPASVVVRDHVLDAREVWLRFVRGDGVTETLSWRRALAMPLLSLFPLRPFPLSLPLFLALAFVSLARKLPRVHHCSGCGRTICRKCHYRVLRRSLCAECNAIRREVRAPLQREEMLAARRRRMARWPRAAGLAVSVLLPGTGQLLAGLPRRATMVASLAVMAVLAAGAGSIWPDPRGRLPIPGAGVAVWVALAVYALLALVSARTYARAAVAVARPTDAAERSG